MLEKSFEKQFRLDRSDHMRRLPHGESHKVSSGIFGKFGLPHSSVSNNGKDFGIDKVVTWLKCQGFAKLESPINNPRNNGLAEWAVQILKKA